MIKFSDIELQYQDCKDLMHENLEFTLKHGEVYRGIHENKLKQFISEKYNNAQVVCTDCCTSALQASLMALNLPKNSRVLLPTLTYAASAQAIFNAGLIPTFVDIDESWLLDLQNLDRVYNLYKSEISAVLTVDLYGQGSNIFYVRDWCDKRNLKFVIDAAQSFGITTPEYNQTIADSVCLSFNAYKNLGGSGGGGAIVTKKIDPLLLQSICTNGKSSYGYDGKIDYVGSTFRMTSIQAACILANVSNYETFFTRKTQIIKRYIDAFSKHKTINFPQNAYHNLYNWYVMPIVVKDYNSTTAALKKNNIEYSSHYKFPLHLENFIKDYNTHACPNAEKLTGRIISLPSHTHLTDEQVDYIIQTIISSL